MTTFLMIFLVWESKQPVAVKKNEPDLRTRVKEIEFQKAEEIYLYHRSRCEQLREVHQPNHKDMMEAELKLKLSRLDLELASINKELD